MKYLVKTNEGYVSIVKQDGISGFKTGGNTNEKNKALRYDSKNEALNVVAILGGVVEEVEN